MANTAQIAQNVVTVLALAPAASQTASVAQSVVTVLAGLGISCGSPPAGEAGVAYTHTFPAGGGTPPYTFIITAGALPFGLALDSTTGEVSGVPLAGGVYDFTVQVEDSTQVASVSCSIAIQGKAIRITLRGVGRRRKPDACAADTAEPEPRPEPRRRRVL